MAHTSTHPRLRQSLLFLFTVYTTVVAIAQPESESPYSDQAFDPKGQEWYESPLAWLGLVVLLGGIFIYLRKQGRRTS